MRDSHQVHDYRGKRGVAWTGIAAPDDAPSWVYNPLTLWGNVDRAEHRSNARFAQEVTLALPAGVPLEVHKELLFRFARIHCLPLRMVVDMSIHEPPTHSGGDARNWHAHLLLTDRPMTPTGFAAHKDRRYVRKALVQEFREGWTTIHNELMAERGYPHRIDHRRLEVQRAEALQRGDQVGAIILDRVPQIHLGKAVHATHPRYPQFAERRTRNKAILTANMQRMDGYESRMDLLLSTQRQQAFEEKQRSDFLDNLVPIRSYEELQRMYGRPATWRHKLLQPTIAREAAATMAMNNWLPSTQETNGPKILDFLMETVRTKGPGHPWFHVSARDFAFIFYRLGLTSIDDLTHSLESIRLEELIRHPAKATKLNSPSLRQPPVPRPQQRRLRQMERQAVHIQAEAVKRHSQFQAFVRRYERHSTQAAERHAASHQARTTLAHARLRARTILGTTVPSSTESDP